VNLKAYSDSLLVEINDENMFNFWTKLLTEALVRLNHKRAAEELAEHVRYLRPAYQALGK